MKRYYYVKCMLDFIAALVMLLLGWWIIVICAIAIKLDNPSDSAFFVHPRIGKGHKAFNLYKLRTMKSEYTGADGVLDHSLTRVGRVVRKLSFDELPQLINILNGTMSFIGPRPLIERYMPYYTERELRRHEVRPGITGLAQVNGRANLDWSKRFAYDVEYVENMSLSLDMKIVGKTFIQVISGDDVIVTGCDGVTESFDTYRMKQLDD